MPDSGGSYTRTDGTRTGATVFAQQSAAAINITDTLMDTEAQDMATALNNRIFRDGTNSPSADLPNNGFKHTGVGNAAARNQYGVVGQIQDNTYLYAAAGGTADAITATFSPAITALVDGMEVCVRASGANTIAAPTFIPNGVGSALTITKFGGQALNVGDIFGAGHEMRLRYRSSATRWELLNPATAATGNMPRSYLAGLGMANGTDATNDIDVSSGAARDSTNLADLVLSSGITKQLDSAWAVGTNQGGRDTGSIANGAWHVYLIKRPDTGVVDVLYSVSASAPTMPANYTLKRRIGSILRESATIIGFSQLGDEFMRKASVLDISANNPGTSAVSRTLSVPTGPQVWAIFNFDAANGASAVNPSVIFTELDRNDEAPSSTIAPLADRGSINTSAGGMLLGMGRAMIRTNTSGQIRSRLSASDGNVTLYIATLGWIDRRGRDD